MSQNQYLNKKADNLYQQYGKPLESKHWGEYIAISPDGETVLGLTLLEVVEKATSTFGPGNFVFKIGERVIGTFRWPNP